MHNLNLSFRNIYYIQNFPCLTIIILLFSAQKLSLNRFCPFTTKTNKRNPQQFRHSTKVEMKKISEKNNFDWILLRLTEYNKSFQLESKIYFSKIARTGKSFATHHPFVDVGPVKSLIKWNFNRSCSISRAHDFQLWFPANGKGIKKKFKYPCSAESRCLQINVNLLHATCYPQLFEFRIKWNARKFVFFCSTQGNR